MLTCSRGLNVERQEKDPKVCAKRVLARRLTGPPDEQQRARGLVLKNILLHLGRGGTRRLAPGGS